MAQGGGQLIVAGREHAAYCFEVLSCYFSGESPASPRFADHHWCIARSPPHRPPVLAAFTLTVCFGDGHAAQSVPLLYCDKITSITSAAAKRSCTPVVRSDPFSNGHAGSV